MRKLLFIVISAILVAAPLRVLAVDEDAKNGLAADTLTIRVGYFGGPYLEARTFTADELWAMNVQYVDFTLIDNMPSVVIDHVAGVSLADILEAAGIDLNSVQSFNFWTKDKTGSYYTSLTKTYLIDTPRYCYYSLPDNFDYDQRDAGPNELATADKTWVPTLIALADDWNRSLAGASFGSDYSSLDTSTRFRLIFGQTNATERTASNSAKWIYSIEVTLGGAPPPGDEATELPDGTVGSEPGGTGDGTPAPLATPADGGDSGGNITSSGNSGRENPVATTATPEPSDSHEAPPTESLAPVVVDFTPVPNDTAQTQNAVETGMVRAVEVRPPGGSGGLAGDGGDQPWRRDEMSDDATILPDIVKEVPVLPAALIALALFAFGGFIQIRLEKP